MSLENRMLHEDHARIARITAERRAYDHALKVINQYHDRATRDASAPSITELAALSLILKYTRRPYLRESESQ